jgi:uncharacterized membrane protein
MEDVASGPRSMIERSRSPAGQDALVGYVLLLGVLLSVSLVTAGLIWHLVVTGQASLTYPIRGGNFVEFVWQDVRQLATGAVQPQSLISSGIAVLMLTPYARLFISLFHFIFVERDAKYALFTAVSLAILTYSLFLR